MKNATNRVPVYSVDEKPRIKGSGATTGLGVSTDGAVRHMKQTRNRVGEAILKMRQAFGETQEEFAKRLNVGRASLSIWETSRPPCAEVLLVLATIAGELSLHDIEQTLEAELLKLSPAMRQGHIAAIRLHADAAKSLLENPDPKNIAEAIGRLEEIERLARRLDPDLAQLTPGDLRAEVDAFERRLPEDLKADIRRADANRRAMMRAARKGL